MIFLTIMCVSLVELHHFDWSIIQPSSGEYGIHLIIRYKTK